MKPWLMAVAADQRGLVTRAQAREAGYRGPELRGLTAVGGDWIVVRRGVYVERATWTALTELDRWKLRDRAALLTRRRRVELSHDSAARLHALPLVLLRSELTHVTRADVQGSRTEHGVKHHRGALPTNGRVTLEGLPATGLARTALDVAREHGLPTGLAACDAALRLGLRPTDLTCELGTMAHWPGTVAARDAALLADPRAENAAESLARLLVLELGIGQPEPQFALLLHDRIVWCDLRVGNHVFEFDGRIKYLGRADGGVAARPAEEVVWAEKDRERLICAEGLGMSRIIWSDFFGSARERAVRRLRAEYAVTAARFGDRLPAHLGEFSARHTFDRVPGAPRAS
jgi:hypothetical protein